MERYVVPKVHSVLERRKTAKGKHCAMLQSKVFFFILYEVPVFISVRKSLPYI